MSDILIVDDERDIRELISDILRDEGFTTRLAANSDECMAEINAAAPALMILDIWLKDSRMDGIDILKTVKRDNPDVPIIIISGHGNIEIAVAAIKQGAYDFIEKPFNIDQLTVVISRAMETSRLRRENASLRRRDVSSSEMIGNSHAFRTLKANLDKVTKSNGRVMLTGEPGSGKELAARFIHANSNRAAGAFISVSSATIEPDRMEEVLFGRETPERGVEKGLLEQAHGGFVYFDEIGDMPLGTQSKILRVLTEQQFTRVGGADKVRVDLRVISSTTRNLAADIAAGRFRQELYDRLNVVPIHVPSLDDRREDIPLLSRHFIDYFNKTQGLPARALTDEADAVMQTMSWPGNIRQLRNVIERVLILGEGRGADRAARPSRTGCRHPGRGPHHADRRAGHAAAARGARTVRAGISADPDQPVRRQYQPHGELRWHGAFGAPRKLKSLGVVTTSKSGSRIAHLEDEEEEV
jgi:two-component system nitrogen regulation response regulator NtrX